MPVPCIPASLAGLIPLDKIREITRIQNPFERDYQAKKAIGLSDDVFSRFYKILKTTFSC